MFFPDCSQDFFSFGRSLSEWWPLPKKVTMVSLVRKVSTTPSHEDGLPPFSLGCALFFFFLLRVPHCAAHSVFPFPSCLTNDLLSGNEKWNDPKIKHPTGGFQGDQSRPIAARRRPWALQLKSSRFVRTNCSRIVRRGEAE